MSNNSTGVYFNDSTKIIYNPKRKYDYLVVFRYFEYMEKGANDKLDHMVSHTFDDYPKELTKKVTLL